MAKQSLFEQLDAAVEAILARPDSVPATEDAEVAVLARIASDLRGLPREEFRARLKSELEGRTTMATTAAKPVRTGFRTVTPYIAVRQAEELIEFVKEAFGAEGAILGVGSAGGYHAEYKIGDSMLMIGGGPKWKGTPMPMMLHLYVPDADATYERALAAGASSIYAPMDQPYGDREAGVRDLAGNLWFIATHKAGPRHIPEGLHTLTPGLFVRGTDRMMDFLKRAFAGTEEMCDRAPDGTIVHAMVRIGDSVVELGEARGEWQPMPSMFLLYVDDVDAWHKRAVEGGATSVSAPSEDSPGGRTGAVKDDSGNLWYLSTPMPRRARRR